MRRRDRSLQACRIIAYSDAHNLTQTVGKDTGAVQDKRLRIVVTMLRDSTAALQNTTLEWVPTWKMVADALTKIMDTGVLRAAAAAGGVFSGTSRCAHP